MPEFERGLIPAVATGAGCLLVKTTVLAAKESAGHEALLPGERLDPEDFPKR